MARYSGKMYKLEPLTSRDSLQIYHSFVHSHLNYRYFVRSFAAKSHIDFVFSKQKSGIRAVMAGFVNFRYRDGIIMKVLTVQNVIAKNALIFMHKITYFQNLLPKSVRETLPNNAHN